MPAATTSVKMMSDERKAQAPVPSRNDSRVGNANANAKADHKHFDQAAQPQRIRSSPGAAPEDSKNGPHSQPTNERTSSKKRRKPQVLDESSRRERNAREQKRSLKLSNQITELQTLLATGGVAVPKGTKSEVLNHTIKYIQSMRLQHLRVEA